MSQPPRPRLVDTLPSQRTIPMKVLCLGPSRTGTMSMFEALKILEYKPYHLVEALKDPYKVFTLWAEAEEAKWLDKGTPFTRRDFDVLLGDYDCALDWPAAAFVDELLDAYPDAKVVMTMREPDSWMESMRKGPFTVQQWWSWPWVAPWDGTMAGPWWRMCLPLMDDLCGFDFSMDGPARKHFVEHYEYVRQRVPEDRLLEHWPQDGWSTLCSFLEVPEPKQPYPRVNDTENFIAIHNALWFGAAGKMVGKIAGFVAVPALAVYIYSKRR